MEPCMHGITSLDGDFRSTMEGWAAAGIRLVEPHLPKAREYEEHQGVGAARRLLDDLGLRAVSSSNQLHLEAPGPHRAEALEALKWKVDLAASLGADRLVIPSVAEGDYGPEAYETVCENLREAADIGRGAGVTLMVEFTRVSQLIATLRTALQVVRRVDHPHLALMLDLYHFWSGMSKFEDLDDLRPGELHHLHIADTPAEPTYEVFRQPDRAWPGEGIAPLGRILGRLRENGYDGPASLELFDPAVQSDDPRRVADKALSTLRPLLAVR